MDVDTHNLCIRLDRFLADFDKWEEPLRRYKTESFPRFNKDGFTWEKFERGLDELERSLCTKHDPYGELFPLLASLCDSYLVTQSSAKRAEIRSFVAERKKLGALVWGYANHLAQQLRGPQDAAQLRLGLAAISIENCRSDYRDTLTTLANLYVGAEEVGIDPQPFFASASELAMDEPTSGGCESLADMLRTLETFAVVRERRARGNAS